ncbi:MAG: acyltransferase [Myxococcota bacterium]|nr:acyltransferase [Myxococcota bacterium]
MDTASRMRVGAPEPASSRTERFAEVDWLKAVGILVVILIHTVRSPWEIGAAPVEFWLGRITRFAVPGFLMASGFLYATRESVPLATTRGRLTRILVPYLVFSIAAQIFRFARGEGPMTGSIAGDLLLANSFGPYYYVFIAAILAATAPLLVRLSPRALALLLVPEIAVQAYFEIYAEPDLFWHLRNPVLWLPYFQLGWMARLNYPRLRRITRSQRRITVGIGIVISAILFALLWSSRSDTLLRALDWFAIWSVLAAMFFSMCGRNTPAPGGAVTRALSDVTYPVYLAHVFFLGPLKAWMAPARGVFEPSALLVPWLGSLMLSLALVYVGRAVLGRRSRTWLGA